jgi:hypothetical protein
MTTNVTTADIRSKAAVAALIDRIDATPAAELPALREAIAALHVRNESTGTGMAQAGRKRAALHYINTKIGA